MHLQKKQSQPHFCNGGLCFLYIGITVYLTILSVIISKGL